VHATWIEAVGAADLVRLLGLMAEDVVFLNPGRALVGRDGFFAGFTAAHERQSIHCVSELNEVGVVGELACTLSRDALSVTPRSGGDTGRLARHPMTLCRGQPDGRWPLAVGCWRATPYLGAWGGLRPDRPVERRPCVERACLPRVVA